MSIYFTIAARSAAEFEALESEGAPEANMGNGAGMIVAEWFTGLPADSCGSFDPADAAPLEAVLPFAWERDDIEGLSWMLDASHPDGGFWHARWERRVRDVAAVIEAAQRLGREVVWG